MAILERFTTIIKSNVNALLDKCEDPAKMVDQYLIDLREDLAEVKKETAGVIAEETRCKRLYDENQAAVKKYEGLARKALAAGNEDDARTFLSKKTSVASEAEGLRIAYEAAHTNAEKMRQMHNKLVGDIQALETKKATIKAKASVAKTQQKVNEIYNSGRNAQGAVDAFSRMEARVDRELDAANAMADLNANTGDPTDELEAKYTSGTASGVVDDELARLKAEMGL